MEAVKRYGWNLLIALDQLANVLFGPLLNAVLRPKVLGLTTGKVYDLANDVKCANVIIL